MEEKGLSIGVLLKKAWTLYVRNWFFLLTTLLIAGAVSFSPLLLEYLLDKPVPVMVALIESVKILLSIWMFLGLLKIYIKLSKEEKATYFDLFNGFPMILNFLVSQILLGLMIIAVVTAMLLILLAPFWVYLHLRGEGITEWITWLSQQPKPYEYLFSWGVIAFYVATIAPVIWITSRFMLMPFFIVDCYEGPVEALKMAGRASRGVTCDLFTLLFATFVLFVVGFAFFGLGFLVTFPIAYIMQTYAYQELIQTTPWKEEA